VLLSLALLAALFVLTGFMARAFLHREEGLAQEWYQRGQAELAAGRPDAAVEALHNALAYSKENASYELRLAQALLAAGRDPEAATYLRTLHESQPGNAPVDLELARLAAKRGDAAEAIRYYVASIYGVWDANGEQRRRETRLELIAFLSAHHRSSEALAQIMSYAANLPPDPALHLRAGELFLEQQSYDHALAEFREALRLEPHNPQALSGAGRALFASGKFAEAQASLERAHRAAAGDREVERELELTRAIVALDPHAPELAAQARAQRVLRDFQLADDRLAACSAGRPAAAAGPLAELSRRMADLRPKLKQKALLRDVQLFESAANTAFDSALGVQEVCGPGSVEDQALTLLARRRSGGAR
jgi:predicted Zn-dependent protease